MRAWTTFREDLSGLGANHRARERIALIAASSCLITLDRMLCRIEQTYMTQENIYIVRAARPFRVFLEVQIMDHLQYSTWQK
jgi:hypothetical protein